MHGSLTEQFVTVNIEPKMKTPNKVKEFRDNLMMSKAELARKAGISVQTLNRIERGEPCRVDTQRKILEALNLTVEEKDKVFTPGSGIG